MVSDVMCHTRQAKGPVAEPETGTFPENAMLSLKLDTDVLPFSAPVKMTIGA